MQIEIITFIINIIKEEYSRKDYITTVALYKLFFFIDFSYYKKHEEAISGSFYFNLPGGPEPIPLKFILEKIIIEEKSKKFNNEFKKELEFKKENKKMKIKTKNNEETNYILNKKEKDHIKGVVKSKIGKLAISNIKQLIRTVERALPYQEIEEAGLISYGYAFDLDFNV